MKIKEKDCESIYEKFVEFCPKLSKCTYDCSFNRANCNAGVCLAKWMIKNYDIRKKD